MSADLTEAKQSPTTYSQGVELAKELGAMKYLVFRIHTGNSFTQM
jgi:hypothetical protein